MKATNPEFRNALDRLDENFSDLSLWEQNFLEGVQRTKPEKLSEKQKKKVMEIYHDYARRGK